MHNEWDDTALQQLVHLSPGVLSEVSECVYCTRLIGRNSGLVLHGGGNSSVKGFRPDLAGDPVETLFVKGSGWDMASIEAPGLTPLPLARMRALLSLDSLSDRDMMSELSSARLDSSSPSPSVETLLHAYLPHRAIQHSHADVIINLTNLANGEDVVREVFGNDVVVVPYVMPGFDLAKAVRDLWPDQNHAGTAGMVLLNHGLFTFGDTSREAYNRHVDLITRAETWLDRNAPSQDDVVASSQETPLLADLAELRRQLSVAAGRPQVMQRLATPEALRFAAREDVASLATRGPLTPDHVIRTKAVPLVGRDVDQYVADYHEYFRLNADDDGGLVELDPAPRVVVDPEWGVLVAGAGAKAASIAADIYLHTIPVLERAEDHLGGYVALDPADLFAMEYWELEQAKLALSGSPPEFEGRIGLVTGAASGIGLACASALLERGAAVVGIDRSSDVVDSFSGPSWLGVVADVTDVDAMAEALRAGVDRFGGLDLIVAAAGVFPPSRVVADFDLSEWSQVFAVNVDSVASLLGQAHDLLVRSPANPSVVIIGSKNVSAPGKGAVAYSASKAALSQLARITALEWGAEGIRVNQVHPDAVFDTGLWSEEIIAERASRYGLTSAEYRSRNVLGAEVTSAQVAEVVVALCGDQFARTTGAQIPIDGGNDRVI